MTTLKCGGQGIEFSACIVDQRSVEDYFVPTVIVTALKSQWENFIFVFLHLVDSHCLSALSSHLWNSLHLSSCGFQLYILWELWVRSDVVKEGEAQEVGVMGWAVCDAHVCDSTAMGLKQHWTGGLRSCPHCQ